MKAVFALPLVCLRLFYQSVYLALSQIWASKLRSILTTIGIVIGVASVEQLKANIRMVREATPMTVAERRELETAMGRPPY